MQGIRNSYKAIREKYKRIGKKNVRLTQSSLLLMQAILGSTTTYKFPILETDNAQAPFPEEIRLNINDEFISYDVGYYLVADASTGVDPVVSLGKWYFTYAPVEAAAANGRYEAAWDAYLQILVNKISRLEKWDMKKHNVIPRTQFFNSTAAVPSASRPSIHYGKDGTKAMQPMLTLSGAKKNDIIVTLTNGAIPTGLAFTWATPTGNVQITFNKLALFFRGMLAQNAARFQ